MELNENTPEPTVEVEVEIDLDDEPVVEAPAKGTSKKSSKKTSAKKEKKPKEKKPPKPLTLHKNYLIDIRRHAAYLGIDESAFGNQLITKETTITVDKVKFQALTIAVADS